jgi:16S rRNA (uracil1498-N3)-methyltransferase
MRRFLFDAADRKEDIVTFNHRESRHISKVLRLHLGQKIELFDGSAIIFAGEIVELGKEVKARILASRGAEAPQKGELWLGQGIIRTKNMEVLLQKCTELGVSGLTPFISNRSQGNLVAQSRHKEERWRRIIEEACKQCTRPQPMSLETMRSFEEVLSTADDDRPTVKILFWEKERQGSLTDFSAAIKQAATVRLLFGPEGGFADSEVAAARLAGWQTSGLGPRILRSETAAIAATAIVQHLLGNM